MAGLAPGEQRMGGMRRTVRDGKVDESKLQKLLDFIDHRMQSQRSKLKRQIEDTQQAAEDMEEKKHKATILLLKNYFEVTSGRVRPHQTTTIHDERLLGTLSEPSMLATVPEIDPDILAKPRSMYDKIARRLDTSRLPLIPPVKRNLITRTVIPPASDSSKSTSNSDESNNGVSTPIGQRTPEPPSWKTKRILNTPPTPTDYDTQSDPFGYRSNYNEINAYLKRNHSPVSPNSKKAKPPNSIHQNDRTHSNIAHANTHANHDNHNVRSYHEQYESHNGRHHDTLKGHLYQRGNIKPTPNVYLEPEVLSPRLGDANNSTLRRIGVSRHTSLRRPMKSTMSLSTVSLADVQPTRKQRAASNLKHALKNLRVPR